MSSRTWFLQSIFSWNILVFLLLKGCWISLPKAKGEESFAVRNNYTLGNDGHLYKYFDVEERWVDAHQICNKDGGHLAIDDSPAVHNYLINTYASLQYWIGVNELATEGTWRFNDGRLVKKAYWDIKQPGNDKKNDDCVAMFESGRWHDDACTLAKQFLCQIKEVPVGYKKGVDGNFYKYFKNKTDWSTADSICKNDEAQLAVIGSSEMHKYLMQTYPSQIYWIGVKKSKEVGTWNYNDGRQVVKGYWDFGQPSNDEGGACAVMWTSARWHVRDCSIKRHFLCQRTVSGIHLVDLMSKKIKNNQFTAPVMMGVIILVIVFFVAWCIVKHRNVRKTPKPTRSQSQSQPRKFSSNQSGSANEQPRFVINLNDTITINPQGSKPISTITKSVVFASSDTTIHHRYPVYNPEERISLPHVFENPGYTRGSEYTPPPSYYSVESN